jgi:hypothetical protein
MPEAAVRENMIGAVAGAINTLKNRPSDPNFEGYIQQDEEQVMECKKLLFSIANTEGVLKWWIDKQIKNRGKTNCDLIKNCHPSWFGRMLDGGHQPLNQAYHRLCCLDDKFREWNQPYFAMNPGTGKRVCVG